MAELELEQGSELSRLDRPEGKTTGWTGQGLWTGGWGTPLPVLVPPLASLLQQPSSSRAQVLLSALRPFRNPSPG